MQETFEKFESLTGHIREYVDNRLSYAKLSVAEKSSEAASNILAGIAAAVIFAASIFFASIALALVLSEWLGAWYLGFLIVAALYLLAGIITWLLRDRLIRLPIMNSLLQQLFKEETKEDEEN